MEKSVTALFTKAGIDIDVRPKPNERLITKELLDELFVIDADAGTLTWRKSRGSSKAGSLAGYLSSGGYRQVMINGRPYEAHRLLWFYSRGFWSEHVHHINHQVDDNRAVNLLGCNEAYNSLQRQSRSPASGFKGVRAAHGRWQARAEWLGRSYHLGLYSHAIQAYEVYREWCRQHRIDLDPESEQLYQAAILAGHTEGLVKRFEVVTTSAYRGVSWSGRHQKWQANARYGKRVFLGYHDTEVAAYAAVRKFRLLKGMKLHQPSERLYELAMMTPAEREYNSYLGQCWQCSQQPMSWPDFCWLLDQAGPAEAAGLAAGIA
jgi:hypothetical protein